MSVSSQRVAQGLLALTGGALVVIVIGYFVWLVGSKFLSAAREVFHEGWAPKIVAVGAIASGLIAAAVQPSLLLALGIAAAGGLGLLLLIILIFSVDA